MKDLTTGNPVKLILMFALPLFIGQIFQLMYSLCDTRIVGEILGETKLASVGATTSLFDLMTNLINGLTNGFAIIIATYFGAKDKHKMSMAIAHTITLTFMIASIVSILGFIFSDDILKLLNISDDLLEESGNYIRIIFLGLLTTAFYNMFAAILRAIGDSFTPLIFLIISAFLNVFLDFTFIKYLNLGVSGASLATVIAQSVSALLCFMYILKKYPGLIPEKSFFRFDKYMAKKLLISGGSFSFMISFVHIGTVALQTSINTFGTNIIVAHTAARKATSIFMMPFSAFGATLATYCGQNMGCNKIDRIREGIKKTTLITFGWCLIVILCAFTIAPSIIYMITGSNESEVIETASLYLRVNTSLYFVPTVICLFRNSMQGLGDTKTPIFSSFLELLGKVLIAMFLAPAIGYWGIIIAEPVVWIIMVIPLIIGLKKKLDHPHTVI